MAIEIVSQSYLPRKPLVVCNADSLAELSTLTNVAEGSKATVNGTEYVYENNSGWVEPGSGGGGSGVLVVTVTASGDTWTCNKTAGEIYAAMSNGGVVFTYTQTSGAATFDLCIVAEYGDEDGYSFASSKFFNGNGFIGELWAETENDYPSATMGQ